MIDLRKGNCLEVMKTIKDNSIDAIITDPPYGTTACKWDSVIPFEPMWEQLNRIIKPNGAIVLFGSEPFSSALRMSNIKNYKYDLIWNKTHGANFFNLKYQPFKTHEIISIFGSKITYNPIREPRTLSSLKRYSKEIKTKTKKGNPQHYNSVMNNKYELKKDKHPSSIINISSKSEKRNGIKHPTKKPILLMEYLIKTYTNENETVLDFTMGSGSTMVACQNLKRNGIGIEQDEKYFKIAEQRIKENEFKLF